MTENVIWMATVNGMLFLVLYGIGNFAISLWA